MRGARVVGVLALCGSLLVAGCVSGPPIPDENATSASDERGVSSAPGPAWDPFYDVQSTNDSDWDPWPDSVHGPQDDTEADDGSSGPETTEWGGSGSTDHTTTDGTERSDTRGPDRDGDGSRTDGTSGDGTGSDHGTDDGDAGDSDDGDSLVDDTNDTVTSTTENTTETLNATAENGSTLDTNLSD